MTLSYARRIELVDQQSASLAAAVAAAEPGDPVPSCPDWTVADLARHHGEVLRGWAAVVAAADPAAPPAWMTGSGAPPWDPPGEDWTPWYVASRRAIREALTAAGEDGPAWTWWGEPRTAGAVARHQVQEACVHRWDAQTAAGVAVDPVPADAAADGVEEFLTVGLVAEPPTFEGAPATVGLHAAGVAPWLLVADGTVTARPYTPGRGAADAVVTCSASDAVLLLYGRIPVTAAEVDGDKDAALRVFA